jgi:hypothetical protein
MAPNRRDSAHREIPHRTKNLALSAKGAKCKGLVRDDKRLPPLGG